MRFPLSTRRPLAHLDRFNSYRSHGGDLEELLGLVRGGTDDGADDDGQGHPASDDPEL